MYCTLGNRGDHAIWIESDTRKMEVYDPALQHGAIKIARGCDYQCLLVETLGYHENIAITKIWKLQLRP